MHFWDPRKQKIKIKKRKYKKLKEMLEKKYIPVEKNTRMPKKFPKDYSRKIKIGFENISLTSEVSL
jgi:hypothetical protein